MSAAYNNELHKMMNDPRLLQMRNFSQHGDGNTYAHCVHVAVTAGKIADRLHLSGVHERELARGAMLHDFYLYTAPHGLGSISSHGITHSQTALENASQIFDLNEIEKDIILTHMWPLTITALPRCRESVLVTVADKYCAAAEFVNSFKNSMIHTWRRITA